MTAVDRVSSRRFDLVFCLAMSISTAALSQTSGPLELTRTIGLPDVRGRIDHLTIDAENQRLFVAALGNDTVEMIDLRAGKPTQRVARVPEPQGIAYVAELRRLFAASGRGARVDVFTGSPLNEVARIAELDDADNVRYDHGSGEVYVGYGSAIAVISARNAQLIGKIDLVGHPESFQLESAGPRMFVNVPSVRQIVVIDRAKGQVIVRWTLDDVAANYPMTLDEQNQRLFVATRRPAALLVYDTQTGRRVAKLAVGGDADDVFYDTERKRIYVICGEGLVDVVQQRDRDTYELVSRLETASGARTDLLGPTNDALYVAVPARGFSSAEIRVYAVK